MPINFRVQVESKNKNSNKLFILIKLSITCIKIVH